MRFHRLLEYAGSAAAVLEMSVAELQKAGVSLATAEVWFRAIRHPHLWHAVDCELERVADGQFEIFTELESQYPERLRSLSDRPPVLYVRGLWPPPQETWIGIVGTRRASSYGIQMARSLGSQLARCEVATVSGLALGVDTAAHEATLDADGFTIAALGHGLGHRYPRENGRLFDRIAREGCLVTEFPYSMSPEAGLFPRRNRIISGLSQGVVVVEAGIKSGAMITARYAAEQGRDVYAVPGQALDPRSEGTNLLIKEGATLVESVGDILDLGNASNKRNALNLQPESTLGSQELEIYQALKGNLATVDELAYRLGKRFDQLAGALLSLELKGLIRKEAGQQYGIN